MRPLVAADEEAFHEFFRHVPEQERLLFKHRVTDLQVIRDWCQRIDYGKILPLLAIADDKIVADASLHQQLGGWKRHIGRISVVVHPDYRGRGLARTLVQELIDIARDVGLQKRQTDRLPTSRRPVSLLRSWVSAIYWFCRSTSRTCRPSRTTTC